MSDWLGVVDDAHAERADLAAWTGASIEALTGVFAGDLRVQAVVIDHDERCAIRGVPVLAGLEVPGDVSPVAWFGGMPDQLENFRTFFYPRAMVMTHGRLHTEADARGRAFIRLMQKTFDLRDALGILLHPAPGIVAVLMSAGRDDMTPSPAERRRLTWLGLHLEAALRMRLRPESLRAVVGPTGRIEHLAEDAPTGEQLAGAVRAMQEARRRWQSGGDALAHWPALAAGELSVVERRIGTRPHYHFFDNPPHRQPLSALTDAEQDAVAAIARAPSIKTAAYELGTSASAVSHRLAGAASKLGLCTTMDLVRLAAVLARDPRARFEHIALTPSEEDVLELVGRGLSNAEIARIRARSARTIANQVASLLQKTQAPNRRALAARVAQRDEGRARGPRVSSSGRSFGSRR